MAIIGASSASYKKSAEEVTFSQSCRNKVGHHHYLKLICGGNVSVTLFTSAFFDFVSTKYLSLITKLVTERALIIKNN